MRQTNDPYAFGKLLRETIGDLYFLGANYEHSLDEYFVSDLLLDKPPEGLATRHTRISQVCTRVEQKGCMVHRMDLLVSL